MMFKLHIIIYSRHLLIIIICPLIRHFHGEMITDLSPFLTSIYLCLSRFRKLRRQSRMQYYNVDATAT